MLRCTQSNARRWSRKPALREVIGSSGELEKPNAVSQLGHASQILGTGGLTIDPVISTHDHNVLIGRKTTTIIHVLACSTKLERATVDPKHDRFASSTGGRCIDIEVQTVLAITWIAASGINSNCEVA